MAQDGDKYDAMKQKVAADAKAHKDAQALVDEKCRFVSTSKPPSKDDAKGFSATIAADADCLLKDPDPLTTCTPKVGRTRILWARLGLAGLSLPWAFRKPAHLKRRAAGD